MRNLQHIMVIVEGVEELMYDTAYPELNPRIQGTQKHITEALYLAEDEWA